MNALDPAMFDAIIDAGARLCANAEVRAVVLSGEGRAFCAGLDIQSFQRMTERNEARVDLVARTHGLANIAQHLVLQWRQIPVPVIAAVGGVAFGGGFQLALGADMRYVHPATKLSVMEIKWGLVPDMAGMLLMRDLARPDVIADLTFSGRIFSGIEAERYGFVTRLCEDPLAEALGAAQEIAGKSPEAIRAAKRILSLHDETLAARILLAEAVEQTELMGSPGQIEAVKANLPRRA
jgi:enoyl-CoA hydratase/carnithine racemase